MSIKVPSSSEEGLTLIEILVTVAIMGISFVVIIGGIGTAIFSSSLHRSQATAGTILRSFAESVDKENYIDCATGTQYTTGSGFTPTPNTYSVTVTQVDYLVTTTVGANNVGPTPSPCPTVTPDSGLQKVYLRVDAPPSNGSETVQIYKRRP
jgi:type II secretory pathway pseudopilin PulG